MSKAELRGEVSAMQQLEDTLKRMRTGYYLDLYQRRGGRVDRESFRVLLQKFPRRHL